MCVREPKHNSGIMDGKVGAEFHHHHQLLQQQQNVFYNSSRAMSNTSSGSGGYERISVGNYYNSPGGNLNLSANDASPGGIPMFSNGGVQGNNSPGSSSTLLLNSVPGLKHDTSLAVEWSVEEQYILEEGLAKYASEPSMMCYIKIAGLLQDKTVRDVALRCRWMARKRRKQEDQGMGRKMKDRKDKSVEFSSRNNMSSASVGNMPTCLTTNHHQSNFIPSGELSCTTRHLLEENNLAFVQISANLSALKLQENIDLFCRARNNITTVLNDMRNMPGIMGQMPPLPLRLNEELASSIFLHTS